MSKSIAIGSHVTFNADLSAIFSEMTMRTIFEVCDCRLTSGGYVLSLRPVSTDPANWRPATHTDISPDDLHEVG